MSGMEREYIRDRTLEGHEPARKRGKTIGGAGVTDESMLSMALHLRAQEMSLRDIAKRLVITTGAKKGHDLGASFAWNNASYPPRGVENFGDDGTNDLADLLAVLLADLFGGEMPHPDRVLAALARTSPADAVDLLWMVAAERADVQEAGVLAEMGAQAAALAERANAGDAPNWPADAADDQEFLARLTGELTAGRAQSVPPQETFGGHSGGRRVAMMRLREALGRVAMAAPRTGASAMRLMARRPVHTAGTEFIGDVLVYFRQREELGARAPIAFVSPTPWRRARGCAAVMIRGSWSSRTAWAATSSTTCCPTSGRSWSATPWSPLARRWACSRSWGSSRRYSRRRILCGTEPRCPTGSAVGSMSSTPATLCPSSSSPSSRPARIFGTRPAAA